MGSSIVARNTDGHAIDIQYLVAAKNRFDSWLAHNRHNFSIRLIRDPMRQLVLLKPLAEYALCNELLASYSLSRFTSAYLENLLWAWEEIEHGDMVKRLLLARPDAFTIASIYNPFRRIGLRNLHLEAVLRGVSHLRSTRSAEVQAWTRLGFYYSMSQLER